jgi:alpha-1,6-mannosyltransferase
MLVEAATLAGAQRPVGLAIFGEGRAKDKIVRAIGGNPHIRLFMPVRERERFAAILASADALLHGCEAETFGMTTAEARASGVPVIAPDRGGASDFADPPFQFAATDTDDAVRAILALPSPFVPCPPSKPVRSMEDHFAELFALYERIAWERSTHAA